MLINAIHIPDRIAGEGEAVEKEEKGEEDEEEGVRLFILGLRQMSPHTPTS